MSNSPGGIDRGMAMEFDEINWQVEALCPSHRSQHLDNHNRHVIILPRAGRELP